MSLSANGHFHTFVSKDYFPLLCSRTTAALAWAEEKGLDAQIVHESEALFHLRKSIAVEREKGGAAIFEDVKTWCANVDDPSNIAR